jgi:hypothetical protein
MPADADDVLVLAVARRAAIVGALERASDALRQVDVGCRDDAPVGPSSMPMIRFSGCSRRSWSASLAHEVQDLVAMREEERPSIASVPAGSFSRMRLHAGQTTGWAPGSAGAHCQCPRW